MALEGNKKPIATCRGDGFWMTNNRKLNDQPTPYRRRHHQVLRRLCAVDMGLVSPSFAGSVNGARAKSGARILFFCAGFQIFLVFTGQFDESGGQADILVNRIAVIIA